MTLRPERRHADTLGGGLEHIMDNDDQITFDTGPGAPTYARRFIESRLGSHGEDVVEHARLLVSELITNAVRHGAGERVTLSVTEADDAVRIEVANIGPELVVDAPLRSPEIRSGGFGLWLVDRLARAWGVESSPTTRVWFELETA